jgi:hypothetical protein
VLRPIGLAVGDAVSRVLVREVFVDLKLRKAEEFARRTGLFCGAVPRCGAELLRAEERRAVELRPIGLAVGDAVSRVLVAV